MLDMSLGDIPPKPDGFGTTPQDVSSILHSLIKEGALRTNIPKLSIFSGERVKGEASFEQWSYELQSLRKTYSESALRKGIQRSLRGAAADTVHNMGPEATLDYNKEVYHHIWQCQILWHPDGEFL